MDTVGLDLQASVFSLPDLNIKLLADLHSCDARYTGAAHSHCTAHVLISMAPSVLSIPPSRACSSPHPPTLHMLCQHVFDDCVVFILFISTSSPLILPLMHFFEALSVYLVLHCPAISPAGLFLECDAVSRCCTCTWAHICTPDVKEVSAWLQPVRPQILSGVLFSGFCVSRASCCSWFSLFLLSFTKAILQVRKPQFGYIWATSLYCSFIVLIFAETSCWIELMLGCLSFFFPSLFICAESFLQVVPFVFQLSFYYSLCWLCTKLSLC